MQLDCDTPPSLYEPLFHSHHILLFLTYSLCLLSSSFLPPNHDHQFRELSLSLVILVASVSPHVLPLILSPGPETPSSVIPVLSEPPSPATTHFQKAVLLSPPLRPRPHIASRLSRASPPVLSIRLSQQNLHVLTQAHIDCQSPPTHYKYLPPSQTLSHLLSGTVRVSLGCHYDHFRTSQRGPGPHRLLY